MLLWMYTIFCEVNVIRKALIPLHKLGIRSVYNAVLRCANYFLPLMSWEGAQEI